MALGRGTNGALPAEGKAGGMQRISFDAAGVRGGERGGAGKPLERKDPDEAESRSRMVEGEVTFSGVS